MPKSILIPNGQTDPNSQTDVVEIGPVTALIQSATRSRGRMMTRPVLARAYQPVRQVVWR